MTVQEPETFGAAEQAEEPNIRHHCGDITTDIVCPHCGRWLVEVFSD